MISKAEAILGQCTSKANSIFINQSSCIKCKYFAICQQKKKKRKNENEEGWNQIQKKLFR